MNRSIVALVVCAGVGLTIAPAWAGPCGGAIAQLEGAMHRSETRPAAIELMLPQTIGAQLGEQPTPESLEQARMQAHSMFAEILGRAKALDQTGDHAGCMQAVRDARNMISFN